MDNDNINTSAIDQAPQASQAPQAPQTPEQLKYSEGIALGLALFPITGALGIHSFYTKSKSKTFFKITDILIASCIISELLTACKGGNVYILGTLLIIPFTLLCTLNYTISIIQALIMAANKAHSRKTNKAELIFLLSIIIIATIILLIYTTNLN